MTVPAGPDVAEGAAACGTAGGTIGGGQIQSTSEIWSPLLFMLWLELFANLEQFLRVNAFFPCIVSGHDLAY
jgi:hypothetical protein